MNEDLQSALIDVRKAYRLIHLYQRRIFDIVERIANEFNGYFYCWTPVYYSRPSQLTTTPLNRWAWDMLPMYNVSFQFLSEGASSNNQNQGDWLLDINVISDSGYDIQGNMEPDPLKFPDPKDCSCSIQLCFFFCSKEMELNWHYGIWHKNEYPEEEESVTKSNDGIKIISKSFDMDKMIDGKSIDENCGIFKRLLQRELKIEKL